MVIIAGCQCCNSCQCGNYKCNNECNYHFFNEFELTFKYLFYVDNHTEYICCCLLTPLCLLIIPFDIISCPCRCCYQECYKKCSCNKIKIDNVQNINIQNTTITQQPKLNKIKKNDLLNLPPHYDEHYRDITFTLNVRDCDNLPPLYEN